MSGKNTDKSRESNISCAGGHFDRFQIGQIYTAKLYSWHFLIFKVKSNLNAQLCAKFLHDITDIDFVEKY